MSGFDYLHHSGTGGGKAESLNRCAGADEMAFLHTGKQARESITHNPSHFFFLFLLIFMLFLSCFLFRIWGWGGVGWGGY